MTYSPKTVPSKMRVRGLGKLRDECLNEEAFRHERHAQVAIERWRCHYSEERPHSAMAYPMPAAMAARPSSTTVNIPDS
jgi:putative transposase